MLIAYGHYVELKAKCERLEDERVHDLNQIGGLQQELASLRASSFVTAVPVEHYERIIKAGDAMASSIQFNEEMAQDYNGPTIVHQSVQRWNAAKEGNAK
jgi:wobble nucleotide-excising tRNase